MTKDSPLFRFLPNMCLLSFLCLRVQALLKNLVFWSPGCTNIYPQDLGNFAGEFSKQTLALSCLGFWPSFYIYCWIRAWQGCSSGIGQLGHPCMFSSILLCFFHRILVTHTESRPTYIYCAVTCVDSITFIWTTTPITLVSRRAVCRFIINSMDLRADLVPLSIFKFIDYHELLWSLAMGD
jgi:hypothetical protein